MQLPDFLKSYNAPSYSASSSRAANYDYSGLDEHIKRQDAISPLRDSKFAALYSGDVAGSVTSGSKIRDLLKAVRVYAPDATERDPGQLVSPLVRVSSESSSNSSSSDGGGFTGDQQDEPDAMLAPRAHQNHVMGVDRRRPGAEPKVFA